MKTIYFILPLLLVGCDRKNGIAGMNSIDNPSARYTPKPGVILAMGQSNMEGLNHPGQNPAIGFQKAFPSLKVINCAVGGTSIGSWGLDNLGANCVAAWSGTGLPVVGIIWYQGESDAYNGITTWDTIFISLSTTWRAKWGNVPIVYAQLATHDEKTFPSPTWDLIKQQQASLRIPNSLMVKTDDLPRQDDVHLTGDASMVVGQRMADAFTQLATKGD